ncbi:MAG: dihydrolipoyl dehydrogenase [Planctomycetaceae bacterium]
MRAIIGQSDWLNSVMVEQMTENESAELVVLGGGPGGYPAAFAAADQGIQVTLVDDGNALGGVCLNHGCIPSKALLHIAKLIHETREAVAWGVGFGEPAIDLAKLREFRSNVVNTLTGGVEKLCKARGVKRIQARGRFRDANTLELSHADGQTSQLAFQRAIIATGSSPAMPAIFDIGSERVMNSTGALQLPDIPGRLLVIGGGYIGLELGTVYAALGSQVTVVEMTAGLLPGADRDLVRSLKSQLEKRLAEILLNTKVMSLRAQGETIVAEFEQGEEATSRTFDRVLVSIGRRPNSSDLGLENTSVECDERGFILVDENFRTSEPNLYSIGDVAGEPMLAHKATHDAHAVVVALIGKSSLHTQKKVVPAVVFTDPELAWCGLTELEAKQTGQTVKSVRFPWGASGRAQTIARTEGLTKLIFDPETDRLLGMGVVGAGAGDLIAEGVLAVEAGMTAQEIAATIHAHPTLSETVMEAAESYLGPSTHVFRKRR